MTDKELIKQEIKRRLKEINTLIDDTAGTNCGLWLVSNKLDKILQFIDSLPEEPASEDLEEACDNYYDETWDEHGGIAMVVNNCHDIWFPSQATSDFFKAGAKWQKQQMMKDAVEAEVFTDYNINFGYGSLTANIDLDEQHLKEGDKVKIIIVKED